MKDLRWRQRFENFEKAYLLLQKFSKQELHTELETAGFIQLFEMAFELSWKVMKDYLEAEGFLVKSPRDTIKQAFQYGLLESGHAWIDALAARNITSHTYDEATTLKLIEEIRESYLPELHKLYEKLSKER